jgi:hypothetical protein
VPLIRARRPIVIARTGGALFFAKNEAPSDGETAGTEFASTSRMDVALLDAWVEF